MVDYPLLKYNVSFSSTLSLPVSTVAPATRSVEAFAWDTSKLLKMVEKDLGNPLEEKAKRQGIRRLQDKENRWILIKYMVWPKEKMEDLKGVKLTLCQPDFKEELEKKEREAEHLAEKMSPILREIDPMDFSDAPEDEYVSEAEYIAERLLIAEEKLSPILVREVFEHMFNPGCCSDDVYETMVGRLRTLVHELAPSSA